MYDDADCLSKLTRSGSTLPLPVSIVSDGANLISLPFCSYPFVDDSTEDATDSLSSFTG